MAKSYRALKPKLKEGFWRVNGYGEVALNDTLDYVYISFSKIADSFKDRPYSKGAETGDVLSARFHISHLCFFRSGSIWKDGELYRNASDFKSKMFSAYVFPAEVHTLRLIDIPSIQERTCNRQELSGNLENARLIKLRIRAQDESIRWLLIPDVEVFRYFFGVSQRMISLIASNQTHRLIDWGRSSLVDMTPTVVMKRDTTRLESALFAEAIANNQFRHSLKSVHKILSGSSIRRSSGEISILSQPHIGIAFPLVRESRIKFAGAIAELPCGDRAYFGMEIVHASYDLGFDSYVREIDEPRKTRPESTERGAIPDVHNTPDYGGKPPEDIESNEKRPNSKVPRLPEISYSNQFDRYYSLFKQTLNTSEETTLGSRYITTPTEIDAFSYEEGGGYDQSLKTQGISAYEYEVKFSNRTLAFFLDMIDALKLILPDGLVAEGYGFAPIKFQLKGYPLVFFPTSISGVRSWNLAAGDDVRPRAVAIIEFLAKDAAPFYLLELELRTLAESQCTALIKKKDGQKLGQAELNEFLEITALQKSWPFPTMSFKTLSLKCRADNIFKCFDIQKFKHLPGQDVTAAEWAERLHARLSGFI